MTSTPNAMDVIITDESVTLSSTDYRHLRQSSDILSRPTLRKKLRWLEYATADETPPVIRIHTRDEGVVVDIDPVYTTRKTLEVSHTPDGQIEGEPYEGVLYRIWFRVRHPERVKTVYAIETSQEERIRRYTVTTVNLDTGDEEQSVVRTSVESDPIPATTADFQLYPHPERGVFDN